MTPAYETLVLSMPKLLLVTNLADKIAEGWIVVYTIPIVQPFNIGYDSIAVSNVSPEAEYEVYLIRFLNQEVILCSKCDQPAEERLDREV